MDTNYKFYFQKVTASGTAIGEKIDLEAAYDSVRYLSCDGIESHGAIKNCYEEDYVEQDGKRVFHPSDVGLNVTREATAVKFKFLAIGDDGRKQIYSLVNLLRSGRWMYWDTARKKKMYLLQAESVDVEEDEVKKGAFIITVSFSNLWGQAKPCDENGNII